MGNEIMTFPGKIPWWGWIVGILIALYLWQVLTGWAYSSKLFNMALDHIREDQSQIIKDRDKDIKECEDDIQKLHEQVATNQKQQVLVRAENERLKGRIRELQTQRENIIIPSDPDRLVDLLHSMGFSSERRIRAR